MSSRKHSRTIRQRRSLGPAPLMAWSVVAAIFLHVGLPAVAPAQPGVRVAEPAAELTAPAPATPAPPEVPAPPPPPLSTRPAALSAQATLAKLQRWVEQHHGQLSAQILEADTGAVWARTGARDALNPASNMKLLTAAAALSLLGSEYRFSTGLYGAREGTHVPRLTLRGEGDPSLQTHHLWRLAHALALLGVRSVGGIQVDQSRFDEQFVPPAFEQQPWEWASFRAPISAVALDRNTVTMNVLAGAAKQPARVWFEPSGVVDIVGQVNTRAAGRGQSVSLDLSAGNTGLQARVGGHVSENTPRLRFERRLEDPRRVPGFALRALLAQEGIEVSGEVTLGGAEKQPRLVYHRSEPLGRLLQRMGKLSDNFYAELMLKAIAAEAEVVPATSEAGAAQLRQWLASLSVPLWGLQIRNGSGLFDANRVSAATITETLAAMYRNSSTYPEFVSQLAIGGVDGTLRSRFRQQREQRRIRAKTGTLAKVISLGGYVLGTDGRAPLCFAFLVNGIAGQAGAIRSQLDQLVAGLERSTAD